MVRQLESLKIVSITTEKVNWTAPSYTNIMLTRHRKFDFLWKLHPAESFPLLLGFFILIQQFSFVSIQAKALNRIFILDCKVSSQVVFTREFICPRKSSSANNSDRNLRNRIHPLHLWPGDDNQVVETH